MKIAVAAEGKYVSGHFGHCDGFIIYDINNKKIADKSFLKNPGHRPGFLPVYLKDQDVDVTIAGGMGGKAQQLFKENGIEVIVGTQGSCDEIVTLYLDGKLKSTGSVCREHQHQGNCHGE